MKSLFLSACIFATMALEGVKMSGFGVKCTRDLRYKAVYVVHLGVSIDVLSHIHVGMT